MALFVDNPPVQRIVADFQKEFRKKEIRTYASSTAFCMLLSLVPMLIIASSVLPYTSFSQADMVDFLMLVLPESARGLVQGICDQAYRAAGGILPLSIVFMLWSSGFGMMQFARGINSIDGAQETRNYFLLRLMGTLYAVLFIVLMVAVLFLQIFVGQITSLWESALPGQQAPDILTSALRYVVMFAMAVVFLLLLFTTMPVMNKKPLQQLPGVLVGVFGCGVLNGLFTLYVNFMPNLNTYYGSLTTVIVMMLWIYFSFYIILFGAFVNRFVEKYGDDLAAVFLPKSN